MATFYLDFTNGNDANDGTTFANRWLTVTSGATAARIAPGDEIRMIQSDDPTSLGSATWTDLSQTVTLASALTANINLCETAWTASTNVTATAITTRKEGSFACNLAIAAGFTTGKIAFQSFTSTDFSSYQQVSLWIRSNVAIGSSVLSLRLCSDTNGDTTVDTLVIPAHTVVNRFIPIAIDNGSALGSSIQSVALYADADPGTVTVIMDDIIACKAPSSADSLTLVSLIGKNTTDETFYGIKSIDDTTVILDNSTNSLATQGRGYVGTTESVTTYKREPILMTMTNGTSQTVQDSGTAGSLITFSGGWNDTDGSTQVGETWLDGRAGSGTALSFGVHDYVRFEKFSVVRWSTGINMANGTTFTELDDSHINNNNSTGFSCGSEDFTFGTLVANNNESSGIQFTNAYRGTIEKI